MSANERERVLARIAEIEQTLRETESDDVRDVLLHAMADFQKRLRQREPSEVESAGEEP